MGASNELPESEELDALYDRFLIRRQVSQVSDAGLPDMLAAAADNNLAVSIWPLPHCHIALQLSALSGLCCHLLQAYSLESNSFCRTFARQIVAVTLHENSSEGLHKLSSDLSLGDVSLHCCSSFTRQPDQCSFLCSVLVLLLTSCRHSQVLYRPGCSCTESWMGLLIFACLRRALG